MQNLELVQLKKLKVNISDKVGISTGNGGCIYEYMANDKNINRSKITI